MFQIRLTINLAVKHVGFGRHIYVFGKGAMGTIIGYFHTLYFFQLFFTLAIGATKLTMWVTFSQATLNTRIASYSSMCLLLDWLFTGAYFQSQS